MSYDGIMTETPIFISPKELAAILDVHLRTVYRYLAEGTVESIKVGGLRKINKMETLKKLGMI